MPQTEFKKRPDSLNWEGKLFDTDDAQISSAVADEEIDFGRKLVFTDDDSAKVAVVGINKIIVDVGGTLTSGNVTMQLKTYNILTKSETVSNISVAFNTDHAQTMVDLVTAVKAVTGVRATTSKTGNVLTIIAAANYIIQTASETAVGLTPVKTNYDARTNAGFSVHTDKELFEENNVFVARYKKGVMVNNLECGKIIVFSPSGFNNKDQLYYIGYGDNRGRITKTKSDNTITAGAEIRHVKSCGANSRGAVKIRY